MRRLLIFFVVGLALFGVKRVLYARLDTPLPLRLHVSGSASERQRRIDRALLAESALAAGATLKDRVVRERLLTLLGPSSGERALDDSALLRLARELDLFHRDTLLEARLASNAELRIRANIGSREPSQAQLQAYRATHGARYQRSERFSFDHVLLARGRPSARAVEGALRQVALLDAALTLRARLLAEHVEPAGSTGLGDPCNLPRHVEQASLSSVRARFGPAIAAALPSLALNSWSTPLESPLGLHLIWPSAHQPAGPQTLTDVRDKLRADFMQDERDAAFERALSHLRAAQPVELLP